MRYSWLACLLVGVCSLTGQADSPKLDYNRDVRPILSDKCFACHGQDAKQRQADLRLDIAPEDHPEVIVAGKPSESKLIARIESTDPEAVMPPPKSHKQLTETERSILSRWIAEGGQYAKHWAFIVPQKQPIPGSPNAGSPSAGSPSAGSLNAGSLNAGLPNGGAAIDYFITQRLAQKQWQLSQPAAAETWLRRASLDLTGLPPTVSETDEFIARVKSDGEAAYEQTVDRLLASPRFGERLAQEWLDVARYADTHGFNNDAAREMWRWRDWVIESFNNNMPYDQFITEQLAGDLLPDATLDQRIATGFCRNHVINSEGGIIEEEYRVEYVADRVRTMSTAWLGLTMECTRCHDHKFDPITQQDYYSLFAFFNNVPEHGEDGRIANAVPMIPAPTKDQQRELSEREKAISKVDVELDQLRKEFYDQLVAKQALKTIGEAVPGDGKNDTTNSNDSAADKNGTSTAASPTAPASGAENAPTSTAPAVAKIEVPAATFAIDCESDKPADESWKVLGEPMKLVPGVVGQAWRIGANGPAAEVAAGKIDLGKRGSLALWLKPDVDCPNDVAILSSVNYRGNESAQGFAKGHELRLIDGELEIRTNDTFPAYAIRLHTRGAKIVAGQWRHIVLVMGGTKKAVNIQVWIDGQPQLMETTHDGLSGDSIAGNATYNLGAERTPEAKAYRGSLDQFQFYNSELNAAQARQLFTDSALPYARQRVAEDKANSAEQLWLIDNILKTKNANFAQLLGVRETLWNEYLHLYRHLPTTMVMQELPQPRPTYVLKRGAYDAKGQQVSAAVPESVLGAWPAGAPRNRLGLARWLTDPNHPLVARVTVNRLWAMLFGSGLVRTLEDFGFQGDYPSHPELLDWLARDFIESGWNTKQFLRNVVLSKTYRQSSSIKPEHLSDDPENRLLAHAPRVRLTAEMLRDQALAVSGLLRERLGGPSVYPYQPEGLYNGLVVAADYPGTSWPTSQGDDLFRRTMYTFCKRTVPHPVMQTFDAPDREFCTARRSRTNTPLQALVLMNEPGFFEAAQALGKRIATEGGSDDAARIQWGFKQVLSRAPTSAEQTLLLKAWQDARATNPETANTVLASIILNLDETVTRE